MSPPKSTPTAMKRPDSVSELTWCRCSTRPSSSAETSRTHMMSRLSASNLVTAASSCALSCIRSSSDEPIANPCASLAIADAAGQPALGN